MAARARKTTKKSSTQQKNKLTRRGRPSKALQEVLDTPSNVEESTTEKTKTRIRLPLIIGLIVLLALLYYFRGLFVAAIVNGKPISRVKVIQDLESQSGQQALDDIITRTLVEQEANKKNITVSQDEVKSEIAKIEESFNKEEGGQSLDDLLAAQGMSREDLNERIRFQKLVEKLLEGTIEVSDDDINKYVEENKAFFPQGTSPEDQKETAKEQLKQQKLNDSFQTLLGNLRNSAKIRYFVNYK